MQWGSGLQDKRVVVLGGSSGIGLEVAKQAASQGASLVIASSSAERVQKAVESIGGEAQGQAIDVSDERAVATFFSKLGTFDHLVFTAGDSLHLHDLAATDLQQAKRTCNILNWSPRAAMCQALSAFWNGYAGGRWLGPSKIGRLFRPPSLGRQHRWKQTLRLCKSN